MRTIRASVLIPALLAATSALAAPPAPTPVTSCGQTVPARARAVLAADLDCTGQPVGVSLGRGARLSLGSFTLSGAVIGVQCSSGCTVTGPGTISGNSTGVDGEAAVTVRDLVLSGFTVLAVDAKTSLTVAGSTITGAELYALKGGRSVKLQGSSISSSFGGVSSPRLNMRGSTITGCTRGFAGSRATLLDGSTIDTSASGPDARALRTWARPRVAGSTCIGRSENIATGEPWGVCSQD
jgi:hypothetical protein